MHREPDVGFDPGSPGSRPGPKTGAKLLRHPGIPLASFLKKISIFTELLCAFVKNRLHRDLFLNHLFWALELVVLTLILYSLDYNTKS